ncbi:MAG: hemin ABC transporter substrate-binding protein [Parvibaculaceae bacterium]
MQNVIGASRRLGLRALAALAVLMLLLPGEAEAGSQDAKRIVAIGSAVVETLYALGVEDRIAAIDTTAVYPARALKEKPNVGYMRALSAEGVLALDPDLIIAEEGAGPANVVEVLKQASVPYVTIPRTPTADGLEDAIRLIGRTVGKEKEADEIASAVGEDLAMVSRDVAKVEKPVRVLFALSFTGGRVMAAGRHTTAEGIIALAGARNALEGFEGYKQASDEAISTSAPEVVLSMAREGHAMTPETIFATPAFSQTPAAEKKRFIAMNGTLLLGFGPRTAKAAHELARALYPDLALTPLPERAWTKDD